jgi:outer membrane lipoprotein-sorting protein
MMRGLFMAFNPDIAKIQRSCAVRLKDHRDGVVVVGLEPTDPKSRRFFTTLTLSIAEADGTLRGISYKDADGDDVQFELTDVQIGPDLPAETFQLKVPDGVRVLTHKIKADK